MDLLDICKIDVASTFEEAKKMIEENDYDIVAAKELVKNEGADQNPLSSTSSEINVKQNANVTEENVDESDSALK